MVQHKNSSRPVVERNNSRRRRESIVRPVGNDADYNKGVPRSVVRKMLNSFTKCSECGDRLLVKNMNAHIAKALLHKKPKGRKVQK